MMFYGGGMGPWGWLMMVFSTLAFFALIGAAVLLALRAFGHSPTRVPGGGSATEGAERTLADRLAVGDIDTDEYEQRLRVLHRGAR
ncbi:SHOCT domain-containing protein [Krasilnikovia sp. MM14-A1004]|uniref:SHOCT domain-containing protein n=1 Tax=Krasilnikovia sp. MM14-A1004 TaxID=3373541 RepID=UPI00399D0D13